MAEDSRQASWKTVNGETAACCFRATEMAQRIERMINKYNQQQNKRYYYDDKLVLTRSELHLMKAINENKTMNVTSLAKLRGVTKGAITQMDTKLIQKGMVEKHVSPRTENEVVISLTGRGREIAQMHERYDLAIYEKINSHLKEATNEERTMLWKLLDDIEQLFDEEE